MTETSNMHLNPEQKAELRKAIDEAVKLKVQQESVKDSMNEIKGRIKEEFGIEKKHTTKLINSAYKHNFNDVELEYEELFSLAEELGLHSGKSDEE